MNCQAVEKSSIAYVDGRIDPQQRREIEAHLAACGACRQRDRQFREIWGVLEESPALAPSPSFDASVRIRIAQELHRGGLWGWLAAPSPRLAIGVTALLVFSIWLSSLPREAQSPPAASSTVDAEFRMIADLPVLEDYDVLSNFDALSELPVQPAVKPQPGI